MMVKFRIKKKKKEKNCGHLILNLNQPKNLIIIGSTIHTSTSTSTSINKILFCETYLEILLTKSVSPGTDI